MDRSNIGATILAVIQLGTCTIACLNGIIHPHEDYTQFTFEVSNVYDLLIQLRFRLDELSYNDRLAAEVQAIIVEGGPIDHYKSALENVVSKFTSKVISGRTVWDFIKADVPLILSKIEILKRLIKIALEVDHL